MAKLGIHAAWTILAAALAIGGCSKRDEPATVQEKAQAPTRYDAEAFYATTSYGLAGGFAWSPDDKDVLAHNDETGIFNVYSLPAAGGEARALTSSKTDSIFASLGFQMIGVSCTARTRAATSSTMCS